LPWGGSGGQLVAGGYLDQASAGLSFDQVLFSARVIQIYDNTLGDWTDTIAISGVVPTLSYFVYVPVPEPATGLLMAGGLAALALAARRHRVG
jgi:hypothetical protein